MCIGVLNMVGKNAQAFRRTQVATMVDARSTVQQAAGVHTASAPKHVMVAAKPKLEQLRPIVQTEEAPVLHLLAARVATLRVAKKNMKSSSL